MTERSKYWARQHQFIMNGNYKLLQALRKERDELEAALCSQITDTAIAEVKLEEALERERKLLKGKNNETPNTK
jgi:hypothetical protein